MVTAHNSIDTTWAMGEETDYDTHTHSRNFYRRADRAHVRSSGKSQGRQTHTNAHIIPGTPPVPSPWRRGHWHHFLSPVSLAQYHSLFSGQLSHSGAARKPPLCNQLPHLNRRHRTAASPYNHTKQLSVTHQQLTTVLQVTFWLHHIY